MKIFLQEKKEDGKRMYNVTLRHAPIFASWTLLRRPED